MPAPPPFCYRLRPGYPGCSAILDDSHCAEFIPVGTLTCHVFGGWVGIGEFPDDNAGGGCDGARNCDPRV